MVLYPAAGFILAVWLWCVSRNVDNGVRVVVAILPFGMFAAISVGGLSLLAYSLFALLTILALVLRYLSAPRLEAPANIPLAGLWLVTFTLYSVFSAVVLVRIFQGEFLVFPVTVTYQAAPVSIFFPSTMVPVQPTNSNMSQSFYVLLSCGFFLTAVFVMRRRGTEFVESSLAWAAGINATLGLLDFFALDNLLSFVRTADYSLLNQQTLMAFGRTIGGFSEASAFGAASAALSSYFAASFLIGRRTRDSVLAASNFVCAILALSTTGFLALAVATGLILLHARTFLSWNLTRNSGHAIVIFCASLICVSCVLFALTPVQNVVSELADQLLFSKRGSLSGIEREALARAGIDVFFQTWGFGAGIGSVRGNGLFSVLLGSVGFPGTLAFLAFLFHALRAPLRFSEPAAFRTFYASRICTLTIVSSMVLFSTVPDPTLLLMTAVALAVAAKESAVFRSGALGSQRAAAH